MCLGCINENLRHRKVIQIEKDILNDYSFNETLAPIISYFTIPTDLKRIRKLLSHLPAYKNNKRDDHIYGATRYVANSLGILLNDANANSSIDSPMMTVEKNQAWRVATFHCRCDYDTTLQKRFNIPMFCTVCLCLVFQHDKPSITNCPGCTRNDSWETIGLPCLACRCAAIIFHNPFNNRFYQEMEKWLSYDESDISNEIAQSPKEAQTLNTIHSDDKLLKQHNQSFENAFQEMKHKATTDQTRIIFENLSILQQSIQRIWPKHKRDDENQGDSLTTTSIEQEHMSPKKKLNGSRKLLQEITSRTDNMSCSTRTPLSQINFNCPYTRASEVNGNFSIHASSKRERIRMIKQKKCNIKHNISMQEYNN